jgi:predicted acetyltransferase
MRVSGLSESKLSMNISSLLLIEPALEWKDGFLAVIDEYDAHGEGLEAYDTARQDFDAYLQQTRKMSSGTDLPPGFAPMTTYWLVDAAAGTVLGESRLRHFLTPALEAHGGHIGYIIRPSRRRQGYGTQILALTLEKARLRGLGRVLVTCDDDNIGSARIIEKNGGALASKGISPHNGKPTRRYWIELQVTKELL